MAEWMPALAAIVGSLLIAIGGAYAARLQRGKHRADAATSLTGSALELATRYEREADELRQQVQELKKRVVDLENRLDAIEKENLLLRWGAERLQGQVVSMGHRPVWCVEELPVKHEAG